MAPVSHDPDLQLAQLIARHAPHEGSFPTPIPGLSVVRITQPMARRPVLYGASLCVVAQGQKRARIEDHTVVYDRLHYLVCALPLPVESEIEHASPEQPFLGAVLDLDMSELGRLLLELEDLMTWPAHDGQSPALATSRMTQDFERAMTRLLEVADDPVRRRVLSPLLLREVYFEALRGAQGPQLRHCVLHDGHARQVAKVVHFLEHHYRGPVDVESMAKHAGMSASALHQHFKQVTSLTPMQYVKKLRLHHARAAMLSGKGASEAAIEVGYASPSQFSRDFRRFFGFAPTQVRAQAFAAEG